MKNWIFFGLLFYGFTSFKNSHVDMDEVRALYQQAVSNENSCKKLIEISTTYSQNNNLVLLGYKASGMMLMAKHAFNPFSKMSYFKKGKEMLEKAIAGDKKNIELRFLRFTAQTSMPAFLGYNSSIEKDKKLILNSFLEIKDANLKQLMTPVLNQSKYLSAEERRQLK